jgi:lipopolysaccharide export system protein LptA
VVAQLDEKTFVYTEELTYEPATRLISSKAHTRIEQPEEMEGDAGHFDYFLDPGLLRMVDDVRIDLAQGGRLRTGIAVFQQKENWATVSQGIELQSSNGWIRGGSGRAELAPGTYRPTRITVENGVAAESHSQKAAATWTFGADWLQSDLSQEGNITHVLARNNARVDKKSGDGDENLQGNEIEADLDEEGQVREIEARDNSPQFDAGDRRLTAKEKIRITPSGQVTTVGESVLKAGPDAEIRGADFSIRQAGDLRIFETKNRATLTSRGQTLKGDTTSVQFDARTNELRELRQEGNASFQEGTREGQAGRVTVLRGGETVILENKPRIVSEKTVTLNAGTITLNQKENSFIGDKDVVMVDVRAKDHPVRVKADKIAGDADKLDYTGRVVFYRDAVTVSADHILASTKDKGFTADGKVDTHLGEFRATSDKLDYNDATQKTHYAGNVWARRLEKQGIFELRAGEMDVQSKTGGGIDTISAKGDVVITQGARRGTGAEVFHNEATGKILLTGSEESDAVVWDPERGEMRGFRIEISRDGRTAVIEPAPNGRVTSRPILKK